MRRSAYLREERSRLVGFVHTFPFPTTAFRATPSEALPHPGEGVPVAQGPASCEHTFALTSKGSNTGQLQRALKKRDVLALRSLAGELSTVPLPIAAEITVLLLEKEPESYAPAARRLLARLAEERAIPLCQLADVAAILAELGADPTPAQSGYRLVSLVKAPP